MSSPLETLFVVWYLGMTQSTCESRPLAFTELQGSLGEVIWLFSGSVVRRLCSLLESTRGMCYRQRAGIGCWVAKATCSAGLYALMCPLECTQLLLHGTTMYCASSLSRMVWDPLVLFCMLKGEFGRDTSAIPFLLSTLLSILGQHPPPHAVLGHHASPAPSLSL